MKRILFAASVVLLVLCTLMIKSKATDFPEARAFDTLNANLVNATLLQTNKVGTGVFTELAFYHTIHFLNSGTQSIGGIVDRSLDNTNWVVVSTNVIAAGAMAEVTMVGKWSYVRARLLATNSPTIATYLGGR